MSIPSSPKLYNIQLLRIVYFDKRFNHRGCALPLGLTEPATRTTVQTFIQSYIRVCLPRHKPHTQANRSNIHQPENVICREHKL
jgi:hypothetical protein